MGATNLTFSATQLIAIVIVSPGRFDGFVRALPGVLMAITTYEGRAGIYMPNWSLFFGVGQPVPASRT
jgi:hypothetical protein